MGYCAFVHHLKPSFVLTTRLGDQTDELIIDLIIDCVANFLKGGKIKAIK